MQAVVDPDGGLFLLSERERVWLSSPIFSALAPLLDGAHKIESIFDTLVSEYSAERVFSALEHLRSRGFLAEGLALEGPAQAAFWEYADIPLDQVRRRLELVSVSVVGLGGIEAGPLASLLEAQSVRIAPEADLVIVLTPDYLHKDLETLNREFLRSQKRWLLVKPVGLETWLGPGFLPPKTACWECLAQRLRGHRKLEAYLQRRLRSTENVTAPVALLPSTLHAALATVATEVTRWIASDAECVLANKVVSRNVLTLEQHHHTLVQRPQCPACGSHASGSPEPRALRLQSRPKLAHSDGGHRACHPREIAARLQIHLSPITGVVGRLRPGGRSGSGELTPTFGAGHNFSDMHDDRYFLREGLRLRSGGKGKSTEQARTSALAESLERYCGVFEGNEPRRRGTLAQLGDAAIHPNQCTLYSERQYLQRDVGNRAFHKGRWVPEPFRDDVEIEWTPLWSLTAGAERYLPTSLCYFGYKSSDPCFARADSNGCAAGGVVEEAVLQGFLELVERDAVALWWYNRLRRPGVELESCDDSYGVQLRDHYRRKLKRELWVLDVASDLGVPAFAAISRRADKENEDIIYGFGAHLDARVALNRALTELNQSLDAVPGAESTDDAEAYRGSDEAVRWWRTATTAEHAYLTPDPNATLRRLADYADLSSNDLRTDVLTCVRLAACHGIETLVLDQTRPDVGFPVVRVVAPGLRHFWARFGPGRLYDVPVREAWLPAPLDEEELNPYVIQF